MCIHILGIHHSRHNPEYVVTLWTLRVFGSDGFAIWSRVCVNKDGDGEFDVYDILYSDGYDAEVKYGFFHRMYNMTVIFGALLIIGIFILLSFDDIYMRIYSLNYDRLLKYHLKHGLS